VQSFPIFVCPALTTLGWQPGGGDAEVGGQIQILFPFGVPSINAFGVVPRPTDPSRQPHMDDIPRSKPGQLHSWYLFWFTNFTF